MIPALNAMYKDALIGEYLQDVVEKSAISDVDAAIDIWKKASKLIEDIIPRVAAADMECGRALLDAWKFAREERDDIRVLSYRIETSLLPEFMASMNVLYGPFDIQDKKYAFEKSYSGFLTVKDLSYGYLHSLVDPMREAYILAKDLYDPKIDEFHILGCGLGYLAYKIWEVSFGSACIHIYEDDPAMLQYALQAGVLSWIDEDKLVIEDASDTEKMLKAFCFGYKDGRGDHYISEWKTGTYKNLTSGKLIEEMDFNERTLRSKSGLLEINIRENKKLSLKSVEDLSRIANFSGKEFVVVSAGPSLDDSIDFLRESVGKRVIVAINASLKRLAAENIRPDLCVVLDPKPELVSHVKGIEEFSENIPLIMTENSSFRFASAFRGEKYVISDYDRASDGFEWFFGGTVASLGLDLAYYLKASKIYLIGSDLAFSEGKNYAGGLSHDEKEGMNNNILVESTDGGQVATTHLYNKYRTIIEGQIERHPGVPVENLARHGAKIKGTL